MSRRRTALLATPLAAVVGGCLLLPACGSGGGSTAAEARPTLRVERVTVDQPLVADQAAVRLKVVNGTDRADRLVAVSSPAAGAVSIHRSGTDPQGRDVMRTVHGVAVPPRSQVTFEPGGLHVMLTGVSRDLAVGDEVDITFTFAKAGSRTAHAEVVSPGTRTEEHDDHG